MCFTDGVDIAENLRLLRNHGQGHERYAHIRIGLNARLDTFQAAVLLAKYKIFADECVLRNQIAAKYRQLLGNSPHLVLPTVPGQCSSVWAQYAILAENGTYRETIIKHLKAHKIPTAVYYPVPIHLQEAMRDLGHEKGDFPVSEDCADRIFSIPMHPYLEESDQKFIAGLIGSAVKQVNELLKI
jgi:dTDP-4-amino-4,6-dideoxygalactose transaminase